MKRVLFLLIFVGLQYSMLAQVTIAEQNFDLGNTWSYSSDVTYFSHQGTNTSNNVYPAPDGWSGDGFYGIIALSNASGLDYSNLSGNLLGERDLEDEGDFGTSGEATTTFSTVDISGFTNVMLSFDYDIEGYNADSDEAFYEVFYDGAGQGRVTLQTGSTPGDDAEGTVSLSVPDGVSTVLLEIIVENNGTSGYSGFDNFKLEGLASSTAIVGFSQSNSSFPEGNTGVDIQMIGVELTNYQGTPVTVTITDAGTGTANSSNDYTFGSQMLTFNANGVQTIDLSINGDTNLETNETIDLVLAVTSGTANIATSNHTVTIVNDDAGAATAQPFFNEIHYDDAGGDNTEFIEVAIPVSFPGNLSDILVTLYNGSNGSSYDTDDLTSFTEGSTEDGYTFYTLIYPTNGIQNGGPDGFALSNNGVLIEFLSYEGIMTANNGVASGEMSTDIGVSESGSETEGQSLQRTGSCTGTCPDGLSWTGPITSTLGTKNTNESLPIELLSFNAQLVNKQVKLTWQTASETNNDYIVVERRTANAFEAIGQVAGAGTTEERQSYEWIDSSPAPGTNYYRLKQVDFDGEYEYHRVVSVEVGSEQTTRLWPNPVTDQLYISTDTAVTEIQVVDVLGQQVEVEMIENRINMDFLPQGVYYIVVKRLSSKDIFPVIKR